MVWFGEEDRAARVETATKSALQAIIAEFKVKCAAVATAADMWAVEDYLRKQRRECEELFDYRYSVLPLVFARFIREGHLEEGQLAGLAEEKLEFIRRVLSL